MRESAVEKLAATVRGGQSSAELLSSKMVPGHTFFALLVDTGNGNDYGGSSVVATGVGYCIGEAIGG